MPDRLCQSPSSTRVVEQAHIIVVFGIGNIVRAQARASLREDFGVSSPVVTQAVSWWLAVKGRRNTYQRPQSVMLMMMFCSVKYSSMSQVVDGQEATGVPQVSGSGVPEVTSDGTLAR